MGTHNKLMESVRVNEKKEVPFVIHDDTTTGILLSHAIEEKQKKLLWFLFIE